MNSTKNIEGKFSPISTNYSNTGQAENPIDETNRYLDEINACFTQYGQIDQLPEFSEAYDDYEFIDSIYDLVLEDLHAEVIPTFEESQFRMSESSRNYPENTETDDSETLLSSQYFEDVDLFVCQRFMAPVKFEYLNETDTKYFYSLCEWEAHTFPSQWIFFTPINPNVYRNTMCRYVEPDESSLFGDDGLLDPQMTAIFIQNLLRDDSIAPDIPSDIEERIIGNMNSSYFEFSLINSHPSVMAKEISWHYPLIGNHSWFEAVLLNRKHCSICQELFTPESLFGKYYFRSEACGHVFHVECVDLLVAQLQCCPICGARPSLDQMTRYDQFLYRLCPEYRREVRLAMDLC